MTRRQPRCCRPPLLVQHALDLSNTCTHALHHHIVTSELRCWQVRAAVFVPLVEMLGRCMATRHIVLQQNLWRTAATAFNAVLVAGMPAINMSHVDGLPTAQAWETLATALEVFLLASTEPALPAPQERGVISSLARAFAVGEDAQQPARPPSERTMTDSRASPDDLAVLQTPVSGHRTAEQAAHDLELEVSVLDTLTDTLLTSCPYASEDMQRRLVLVVDRRDRLHCNAGSCMPCVQSTTNLGCSDAQGVRQTQTIKLQPSQHSQYFRARLLKEAVRAQ